MSRNLKAASLGLIIATFTALPVLAEGDIAKGEKVFKKCAACHTVENDGSKRAGPHLEGIIGRTSAAVEGFAYSGKMKELGAEGHIWTAEELEKFLENPKKMVPGTKMSFAGLKKPEERTDLVAYLASLGGAAATEEAAPAEGEAAPAETEASGG
ncbi:c-type cytochrome [Pseudogemmobacter faecipullorum]|uniref:Cytochrome c family protein n=1 Tax=Pseudogemmobacter faecipullorum TaxID=2755041 RepID=A0ABS8CII9_9RHOB|nr:cytochrome c family protein [Pseudogemmobacter faecipullorum]MCB5409209.1 cytochrome c family protein [Pseudogemmobacter faecipullorum]